MPEQMMLKQAIAVMAAYAYKKDATGIVDAWEVIKDHLNTAKDEAVAWTVVGPDGKTSIGGWHDMRTFEHIKGWATLREGHQYAFAYADYASPDVVRDAERYRWLRKHSVFANDSMHELWFDASLDRGETEQLDKQIDAAIAAQEGGE